MQFRPIWNWVYEHKRQFATLEALCGSVALFGEWMWAQHGVYYDSLPDWLLAYDVWDINRRRFLPTDTARKALYMAGFSIPPVRRENAVDCWERLEEAANARSEFSTTERSEGVYVRVYDDTTVTHRFKMVRQGFCQGELWDAKILRRNNRKTS